jgi:redox-sensitive bicupin YhaK (pirin superfamily)
MVVNPAEFERNDPFIALMDDRVDRPEGPLGGAHPHAGFETVTLTLEGSIRDRDEGTLESGDALWMTAGSGVIHNEEMVASGRVRVLQLWLTLSKAERWAEPRFERIPGAGFPCAARTGRRSGCTAAARVSCARRRTTTCRSRSPTSGSRRGPRSSRSCPYRTTGSST